MRIAHTCLAVIAIAIGLPTQTDARPISGGRLSRALEICIADGGQEFDFGDSWGCCDRANAPPFCVICEGEPSGDKVCDISSARNGRPPKGAVLLPRGGSADLNGMLKGN